MTPGADALIVLQARLGSHRLPGKVLAPIEGYPLVEYCLRRLQAAAVGPVVLATTTLPDDQRLRAVAQACGAATHAGPVDDVLGRFAEVVDGWPGARYVIRATADNPFVDIDAPTRVLKALRAGADYAVEEALPVGTAVEGMSRAVLLRAQREATTPYDREHVTPWARHAEDLVRVTPVAPLAVQAPDLHLTVDTPEDLTRVRRIAARLSAQGVDPRFVPLTDIVLVARALSSRPA